MLTQARLKQVLDYDPTTGHFIRKYSRRTPKHLVGKRAGGLFPNGYRRAWVDKKQHSEHRLVWLYVFGRWPVDEIDHVNGVRDDNRLENLRESNGSQNRANRNVAPGVSGLRGAYLERASGRWFSSICVGGRSKRLGTFDSPEEAHEAWKSAAQEAFGEFARV